MVRYLPQIDCNYCSYWAYSPPYSHSDYFHLNHWTDPFWHVYSPRLDYTFLIYQCLQNWGTDLLYILNGFLFQQLWWSRFRPRSNNRLIVSFIIDLITVYRASSIWSWYYLELYSLVCPRSTHLTCQLIANIRHLSFWTASILHCLESPNS